MIISKFKKKKKKKKKLNNDFHLTCIFLEKTYTF